MTGKTGKTPVQVLTAYFNQGEGKRSISAWRAELNEFNLSERREFARKVCAVTGDILSE